jgi:hypothetical protein
LSITPPLFQLTALPGDVWQSNVKVVNANPYPMTVFAHVVDFDAEGEVGQGKFVPIIKNDGDHTTLAEWIEVSEGPYVIPAEQTQDIPFFVDIPDTASPGGHYAALMVSTHAPEDSEHGSAINTSQSVTSLFFVRINGDIQEEGVIREFRVTKKLLERPETEFIVRFQNKGNVHLLPRGDIRITNMWGAERGIIPINHQTHFGNVLPQSIREFTFGWKSEFNITDIGRYKAIVTLSYGEDEIKNVTSTSYFWVIPIKATLITIAVLGVCITLIVWMVKMYIHRVLVLAGVNTHQVHTNISVLNTTRKKLHTYNVSAPITSGVLDLRNELKKVDETLGIVSVVWSFICTYKKFFISICILISLLWYCISKKQ